MIGAISNSAAIALGTFLGIYVSKRSPGFQGKSLIQVMGCFVLVLGLQSALTLNSGLKFVIIMGAILLGGLLGELLQLETRMNKFGEKLKAFANRKWPSSRPVDKHPVQAFITASLLFCIGPMAILGSFQEGLKGDASILLTKAVIDGSISIAFGATLGLGAGFSAISIFAYQGFLSLFASELQPYLSPNMIDAFSSCGGMLLIFTSANLLGITQIRVANLLPALVLAAGFAHFYWR